MLTTIIKTTLKRLEYVALGINFMVLANLYIVIFDNLGVEYDPILMVPTYVANFLFLYYTAKAVLIK